LDSDAEHVQRELELPSDRFSDPDAPVTKLARRRLARIFRSVPGLGPKSRQAGLDIALRFLQSPSFLVRYVDLGAEDREQALRDAFSRRDQSGRSLSS
jgi:hypothetical protein